MMFTHVGPAKPLGELESRTLPYGRFYKIDDGWLPSVTTVVSHNTKAGILAWEKVGYTEAERVRRAASWRGTKYHGIVEDYLNNELEKLKKARVFRLPFRSARETLNRISNIHALKALFIVLS